MTALSVVLVSPGYPKVRKHFSFPLIPLSSPSNGNTYDCVPVCWIYKFMARYIGKPFSNTCVTLMEAVCFQRWPFLGPTYPRYSFSSPIPKKAECGLSSLSCVWMYVDQNQLTPPPPRNGISTGNSLISSPDLDSPQKFILDWYLFLNGCLQITLIQIYFWYYKNIWGHFNNGCLFLLQTTQPVRMQGQQKILPPAGEEGHASNENVW